MSRTQANELRDDLELLIQVLQAWRAQQSDPAQLRYLDESVALVGRERSKLGAWLAGTSALPEHNVYLSVSSLAKGLNEIGANWQNDPRIRHLIQRVTDKAYDFYKATRP
jgi:hypothetical protein